MAGGDVDSNVLTGQTVAINAEALNLEMFKRTNKVIANVQGRTYFTAPKVRPRTSWRWLIQPKIKMGAIAMVEAADSLAQNNP